VQPVVICSPLGLYRISALALAGIRHFFQIRHLRSTYRLHCCDINYCVSACKWCNRNCCTRKIIKNSNRSYVRNVLHIKLVKITGNLKVRLRPDLSLQIWQNPAAARLEKINPLQPTLLANQSVVYLFGFNSQLSYRVWCSCRISRVWLLSVVVFNCDNCLVYLHFLQNLICVDICTKLLTCRHWSVVRLLVFTCDSTYAIACICYSIRLSITRVNPTKTVEVRIMKFLPYGSPMTLVFEG